MEVLTLHCELEEWFWISIVRGLLSMCLTLGVAALFLHSLNFAAVCWRRGVWLTRTATLIVASNLLEADSAVQAHCQFASSLLLKMNTSLSMLHLFSGRICCCLLKCWMLLVEDIETCPMRYGLTSWTFHGMTLHSWYSSIHMRVPCACVGFLFQ